MTLRRQPSDFRVDEVLSPQTRQRLSSDGAHAVYALEKTSLTTPDAVNRLARELGVRPDQIGYAGLKDKHAQTLQHVSVPIRTGTTPPEHITPTERSQASEETRWSAALVGRLDAPLSSKDIDANRFILIVRDLARETCDEMMRRARLLAIEGPDGTTGLRIVNYFGAQRFGSARHGGGWIARALMAGDFEAALRLAIGTPARKDSGRLRELTRACARHWGDWKKLLHAAPRLPESRPLEVLARASATPDFRKAFAALPGFLQALYLEAYQSHLWNRTAHELVREHTSPGSRGPLRSDDEFGEMIFPIADEIPESLRALEVPLLARKTILAQPWAGAARRVLEREGISTQDLRVPGVDRPFFGEAPRRFLIDAADVSISAPSPDPLSPKRFCCEATFSLPRGAYATVVMRALGQ